MEKFADPAGAGGAPGRGDARERQSGPGRTRSHAGLRSIAGWALALAFMPFLMALKPCTVANFSPLLGAFWTSFFILELCLICRQFWVWILKLQIVQSGIDAVYGEQILMAT